MVDKRWDRIGAFVGLAFVAVMIIGAVLPGTPPDPKDAERAFVEYMIDKRTAILAQAWLFTLAMALLLWFVSAVRSVLRRAEGDTGHLANLFFMGASALVVLNVAAFSIFAGIAYKVVDAQPAAGVVRAGYDTAAIVSGLAGLPFAVALLAFAVVVRATTVLPRWTAVVALVAAVANVIGSLGLFAKTGAFSPESIAGFAPLLLNVVWVVSTAVTMLRTLNRDGTLRT